MDALVDESAHLPRKLGFAPKNEEIYKSDGDRKAARSVLKDYKLLGESCDLVVKTEDSQLIGCVFEPRRHILDAVSKLLLANKKQLNWTKKKRKPNRAHQKNLKN
jgi:hypothetical protein